MPVMQLPDLAVFVSLNKLDLSMNQLRTMAPLSSLQALELKEVYLTSNKLSHIEVIHCLAAPLLQLC